MQQAAEWFARLTGQPDDPALRQAWQQWHGQSDQHRLAWQYMERVSQRFAPLHGDVDNAAQTLQTLHHNRMSRRQVIRGLGALSCLAALGWAGWRPGLSQPLLAWQADLRTATGEIAEHVLADGSRLWLNSASALDIDFNDQQRHLRLYTGEVLVSTAADPRPLRLHTRHGSLQPLGTRFSVQLQAGTTRLSVFEGKVRAHCVDSGREQTVEAGHSLGFDGQHFTPLQVAQAQRQAWSQGILLAEDIELGQLIETLGQYRHGYLGVDPQIAGLKVMGAYPLHDTDLALAMLERALPIRIQRTLPWWVNVRALGPRPD
ncbi:FecR domain-containing protein [Pseudomonas sp. JQ170]|nr:FecR domain-containing protein [Pseudomonas sp. JQ170]